MMPDRWQKIEELYHSARERDESQRVAFLNEACAGDEALRQEVESLLAEENGAKSLLESPALEIVAKEMAQDQTRSLLGERLGSYQVLSLLGAGGMGEVYRARDSKLQRDVAIKVLPKRFVDDPDRLGRFRREAQLLASLNHPNIATIHGLEESDGLHYLVMELVAGETLAQRIARAGLLPISEALSLGRQIAEALEGAHEKGVIHRDLKPANVKVTPEGRVKVLDFGLAKAFGGGSGNDPSNGPTLTEIGTEPGVVLGTPSYMSPEQARGKAVDKRTDIWAFGCVLYELLTGRQAFRGESSADSIAAVVEREPDWKALPPTTSVRIRDLLRRCLQKDVNRRLRDIGDARIEIEDALTTPVIGELASDKELRAPPRWQRLTRWGLASLVGAAMAVLAVWALRLLTLPTPQPISRFTVALPPDTPLNLDPPSLAISPDGTRLVYAAVRGGTSQLYLRALDQVEARPIQGAEGGQHPFFSPDGEWLGFFADAYLKKVPLTGGPPVALCNAAGGRGGTWGDNGGIVFAPESRGGLYLISSAGGTPRVLATPDATKGETGYRWPHLLPGGKEVLFTVLGTTRTDVHIVVQSLKTGERRVLVRGANIADAARYVPTGYLVYSQTGTLMAAPFDVARLELTGPPVPVVEDVAGSTAAYVSSGFSFSRSGTLVYVRQVGGSGSTLVWVDRKGAAQPLVLPPRRYGLPRFSPEGRRLAVSSDYDIWLYDIPRQTFSRLTFGGNSNFQIWSPDGKRVAFASNRAGPWAMFWKLADGSGPDELLMRREHSAVPQAWSPDGRLLAFLQEAGTGFAIGMLPVEGQRQPWLFLQTQFVPFEPTFSPDGRWLAYTSNETGRAEIYVQAFPGPGGRWQISTEGGREPAWARNPRELFYRNGGKMMMVEVTLQPSFRTTKPRMLFEGHYAADTITLRNYDVAPDGQRFVMIKPSEQELSATQIDVVLNWFEELKRQVGPGKK